MIVVFIVLLGVSLAAFNVWFRYSTTNQIHGRWGTAAMLRIAEAPEATWWELEPPGNRLASEAGELDSIVFPGLNVPIHIRKRGDLITARGFVNLRYALGQNGSYDFSRGDSPTIDWRWAMIFDADGERTVVLVDENFRWLRAFDVTATKPEGNPLVRLTDKMSAGLKTFFEEQRAAK
jgi:hypothetical protein